MPPLTNRSHVVYRMYDAAGRLLYVGVTWSVEARFRHHRRGKPWWPEVDSIRFEHFPSRGAAVTAELAAIKAERPAYNVRDNIPKKTRSPRPPSPRKTPQRTVAVDAELWQDAKTIARKRGETISGAIRRELVRYLAKHRHLLDEALGE